MRQVNALTRCAEASRLLRGGIIPRALLPGRSLRCAEPQKSGRDQRAISGVSRARGRLGQSAVAPYRRLPCFFFTSSAAPCRQEARSGGTAVPPPQLERKTAQGTQICILHVHGVGSAVNVELRAPNIQMPRKVQPNTVLSPHTGCMLV
jgi:hypothetical protein